MSTVDISKSKKSIATTARDFVVIAKGIASSLFELVHEQDNLDTSKISDLVHEILPTIGVADDHLQHLYPLDSEILPICNCCAEELTHRWMDNWFEEEEEEEEEVLTNLS